MCCCRVGVVVELVLGEPRCLLSAGSVLATASGRQNGEVARRLVLEEQGLVANGLWSYFVEFGHAVVCAGRCNPS